MSQLQGAAKMYPDTTCNISKTTYFIMTFSLLYSDNKELYRNYTADTSIKCFTLNLAHLKHTLLEAFSTTNDGIIVDITLKYAYNKLILQWH